MADPDEEKAGPQVVPDTPTDRSPSPTSRDGGHPDEEHPDDRRGSSEDMPSK